MADEQKGRVVGRGPCPNCGKDSDYKLNKKEHLYVYCVHEGDGGCLSGTTSRSASGDKALAGKVTKWTSPADKKRFCGEEKPPADTTKKSFWDAEIL